MLLKVGISVTLQRSVCLAVFSAASDGTVPALRITQKRKR
jgi:hypothetical protein